MTCIDYVELVHPDDLVKRELLEGAALLAIAVRIGTIRLINNAILAPLHQVS